MSCDSFDVTFLTDSCCCDCSLRLTSNCLRGGQRCHILIKCRDGPTVHSFRSPPQPPTPTPLWPFPAHRFHPLSPPSPPHKFLFAPLSRLKLSHPQAVGRGKGREAQAAVSLWLVNDSYNDSETSVCQCPLSLRGNRGILGISFLSHPLAYYPLLPPPPSSFSPLLHHLPHLFSVPSPGLVCPWPYIATSQNNRARFDNREERDRKICVCLCSSCSRCWYRYRREMGSFICSRCSLQTWLLWTCQQRRGLDFSEMSLVSITRDVTHVNSQASDVSHHHQVHNPTWLPHSVSLTYTSATSPVTSGLSHPPSPLPFPSPPHLPPPFPSVFNHFLVVRGCMLHACLLNL